MTAIARNETVSTARTLWRSKASRKRAIASTAIRIIRATHRGARRVCRYDYISDKRYAETYNASNYGASLFTRFNLKRIYLHAEYAGYNYKLYNELGGSHREWIPFLFLGAGFSQRLGGRTSLNAQILFDVLHDDGSPYGNWEPFYSIGIGVGF